MSHKTQALQGIKDNYNDLLTEYFFLSVSYFLLSVFSYERLHELSSLDWWQYHGLPIFLQKTHLELL
jgi:hypothetical protein